jgi:hypothetical protein
VRAKSTYGNLPDSDRIFTNIYGEHDRSIKGAEKRVGREGGRERSESVGTGRS